MCMVIDYFPEKRERGFCTVFSGGLLADEILRSKNAATVHPARYQIMGIPWKGWVTHSAMH